MERNAIIESAEITNADHGILSAWLTLDFGNYQQGFGGFSMYIPGRSADYGGWFIWRILEIAGVNKWSHLKGKTIRAKVGEDDEKILAIGHVVKNDWFDPLKTPHGDQEMNRAYRTGFTLIELMIVVAIIAILAAIALPQYTQYTIRSRLSEALLIASQCRTAISEIYQVGGVVPAADAWNCGEGETKTKYVATLATSPDGVVTITTSNDTGLGVTAGKQLTLTPLDANGAALTAARIPVHVAGFRCAPVDIPVKYLPTACQ